MLLPQLFSFSNVFGKFECFGLVITLTLQLTILNGHV